MGECIVGDCDMLVIVGIFLVDVVDVVYLVIGLKDG